MPDNQEGLNKSNPNPNNEGGPNEPQKNPGDDRANNPNNQPGSENARAMEGEESKESKEGAESKEGKSGNKKENERKEKSPKQPAEGEEAGSPQIDPSSPDAIRERMDIDNHPDVKAGEINLSSEKDKEFQELYDKRVILPRHESQDGIRNRENRSALKDAGIKHKGFNNDLHQLNIERVLDRHRKSESLPAAKK